MIRQITDALFELHDEKYRDFHARLIPNVDKERIIGVRTPDLRKFAKSVYKEEYVNSFLEELPHFYYEENNLHAEILLLRNKNAKDLIGSLEHFLPYVDNWATSDMIVPKVFKKEKDMVYPILLDWLDCNNVYQQRFAIVSLMKFFLDNDIRVEMFDKIAAIRSEEYYIQMAQAWFFSEALVKQYDFTISYIKTNHLEKWTHNKAIQKARESLRLNQEQKKELNQLKIH